MRIGYDNYKSERECSPRELDGNSILRHDNVIITTKEEIYEICDICNDKEKCIKKLKEMKTILYANLNKWN